MELSSDLYRAVLESLPIGVYLVDKSRRIVLWNAAAERITGYLCQEAIGRYCHEDLLMHCDQSQNILCGARCPLALTMHDGRPRETDAYLRHKNGQRVPVRVRGNPVHNEFGEIVGAVECFEEHAAFPALDRRTPLDQEGSSMDEVTNIPDKEDLRDRLQAALEEFAESRIPFAVLSVAIDDVDRHRHTHGRLAVDALMYAIGETLACNLRLGDAVGRWSSERFVVLLDRSGADTIAACARRLQRLVGVTGVPWWGDRISAVISIGGTVVREGDTPDSLVERAEEALAGPSPAPADSIRVA